MHDDRAEAIRTLVAQWLSWAQSDLILAQMTEDERLLHPSEEEPVTRDQAREAALTAATVLTWVEAQIDPGEHLQQLENKVN